MCDDIIATAGTISSATKLVKERGAEKIYVGATHGVFTKEAAERLNSSPIDELVVTDTIPLGKKAEFLGNVKVLSVASMLGDAIKRIHRNESVSSLFGSQ